MLTAKQIEKLNKAGVYVLASELHSGRTDEPELNWVIDGLKAQSRQFEVPEYDEELYKAEADAEIAERKAKERRNERYSERFNMTMKPKKRRLKKTKN